MIDLNADLGEGIGDDAAMLAIVTSASIACGGHAGNEVTMRNAVRGAIANRVRIGAHPGFVDPDHFGRRRLDLDPDLIREQVLAQIAALESIVREEGARIEYLKLHGALANMAAENLDLAETIFSSVAANYPQLAIMALANSAQEHAARALGLEVISESYADRAYSPDGLLVSRSTPGSVIKETEVVVARCLRLAAMGEVVAMDGSIIPLDVQSICLHGDTPGALELARAVRTALEAAGFMTPRQASSLPLR